MPLPSHYFRQSGGYTPRRAGYVLLLTLLLLALVALAMVGLARNTLALSLAARSAQDDLQRRWGNITLQAGILPHAATRLEAAEKSAQRPLSQIENDITLGDLTFSLRIADEAAALPADALLTTLGKSRTEAAVRDLIRKSGSLAEVRLEPWTAGPEWAGKGAKRRPRLVSYAAVFPAAGPEALHDRLASRVSLWGGHAINVRRADPEVVRASCGTLLPAAAAASLQAAFRLDSKLRLDDALTKLSLADEVREKLGDKLTDTSSSYSLWIVTRAAGNRTGSGALPFSRTYRLAIQPGEPDADIDASTATPASAPDREPPPLVFEW